jgi:hypothetical protein
MKTSADDWHFRSSDTDMLLLDLFLSNAQHAMLQVYPMKNAAAPNGQIPEMVVFCEFPGERIAAGNCVGRWIARPPDRSCPWSSVELPPALMQQIRQRLGYSVSQQPVAAA